MTDGAEADRIEIAKLAIGAEVEAEVGAGTEAAARGCSGCAGGGGAHVGLIVAQSLSPTHFRFFSFSKSGVITGSLPRAELEQLGGCAAAYNPT